MEERPAIAQRSTWMRVFHVIFFALLFQILELALALVAVVQLLSRIAVGHPLEELSSLGRRMAGYTHDIVAYITFASEEIPFPFDETESAPAAPREEPPESVTT